MRLRTIVIGGNIILITITVLVLFLRFPISEKLWFVLYKKDVETVRLLSQDFGIKQELHEPAIKCWEVLNSRCGIVFTFTTEENLITIQKKIDDLGWEQKLPREVDSNSLFTDLRSNTTHKLYLNDQENSNADLFNKDKNLRAWSWWLVRNNQTNIDVTHYTLPATSNYRLDNEKLSNNIMEITLYIKGR